MTEAAVALAPWIAAQRTSLLAQRGHAWPVSYTHLRAHET